MRRYIFIDSNSGYIWGDSADFATESTDDIPALARMLDESIGEIDRAYVVHNVDPRTTATGYHVYRADVRGSEQVGNIHDGQDQEMIEAVERDCEYVGFVEAISAADD